MIEPNPVPSAVRDVSHPPMPGNCRHGRTGLVPTRYGWAYLVMLTAMLVGSINYGNNFGFLLTFLLGGVGLVSTLHTWRNLSGVMLVSGKALPVFAGEAAVFEIVVRDSRAGGKAVEIGLEGAGAEFRTVDLDADQNRRVRLNMAARRRGRMATGPCVATTVHPLGLFRRRRCLAEHLECLVYPAPERSEPTAFAANGGGAGSEGADENRSGSEDFQGLNAYRPGDPLQRISWKASSRGQGLYTKDFTGARGEIRILAWDAVAETDIERKLSILCGQVLDADRNRDAYGLELPGRFIPPGGGETHRHRCLTALALFPGTESS